MHLTITPDGPRGPRRKLAVGPIYLASQLGLPIVPLGFGIDRPWRAKSWDSFAVPKPFSQIRSIVGPEIHVPKNIERDDLEHYRQATETLLTDLTVESEQWAESGSRREGEVTLHANGRVLVGAPLVVLPESAAPPLVAESAVEPAVRLSA